MVPEAQPDALYFDPNGPGMGLDVDFNNFDLGDIDAIDIDRVIANLGFNNNNFNDYDLGHGGIDIINNGVNNTTTNFDFEDTVKGAEISLGPPETLQEANTSSKSVSQLSLANERSNAFTLADAYNPGSSTCQEPAPSHSNEMRAPKRKKTDEVDKDSILPEGSRRNRNKTARARGLDSLT